MNKVIIVTQKVNNKILHVYSEDANIPELYKQKKELYHIQGYEVKEGIQYEVTDKLELPPDNLKYFENRG